MAPKASGAENQLNSVGTQDIATQNRLLQDTAGRQGKVDSTLGQFEGPVESSPFYMAQVRKGLSSTTGAYRAARGAARMRANAAGYNDQQGPGMGAENELGNEEAAALARVPTDAMLSTAPLAMSAASGQLNNAGLSASQQNTYNPNAPLNDAAGLYNQRKQIGRSFISGLASAGTSMVGGIAGKLIKQR